MYMALLCEVQRQRALFVVPRRLEIVDDVFQERERGEDADLLPGVNG